MRNPPTPTQEKAEIRLTIPVTAEVHAAFSRVAKAGKMPIGRAMGEWLADTVDAANFMAETMEKARAAPKIVAQELHAYALGLGDETGALLKRLRETSAADRGGPAERGVPGGGAHPPSNTGVTNTNNKPKKGPHGKR